MSKFEKLKTALKGLEEATEIAASNFPDDVAEVSSFFEGALSASGLTIERSGDKKLVNLSKEDQITVTGKTQLFGLQEVELTLEFTEPGENLLVNAIIRVLEEDQIELSAPGEWVKNLLGNDVFQSLPEQMLKLPLAVVKNLKMEVGPKSDTPSEKKTIKRLNFELSSEDEWWLIPDYLATTIISLYLNFENLLRPAEREISGSVSSSLNWEGTRFDFALEKSKGDEKWILNGQLAEGTLPPLSFASRFMPGIALPGDFPDFNIDEAEFTVDLLQKKISFSSGSSGGLEIVKNYDLKKLGFGFVRTSGAEASLEAALTGTLNLKNVELDLEAELGESDTTRNLHFEVSAATEETMPISDLIGGLGAFGEIDVPSSLDGTTLSDIRASYDVGRELSFRFSTKIETGDLDLKTDIRLRITKEEDEASFQKAFEGLLTVGKKDPLVFELMLASEGKAGNIYAALQPGQLGVLSFSDLFHQVAKAPEGIVPEIEVALVNAFIYLTKIKEKYELFFGVEVDAGMTFGSGLPLVGPMLEGQQIGVDTVLFSYTTVSFTLEDLKNLNQHLPRGRPKLPELNLNGGIGLSFSMSFGKVSQYFSLPLDEQEQEGTAPLPSPSQPVRVRKGKWFAVNKRLGPLNMVKMGVNFQDKVLNFGMEASLALGPLTLTLEEFSFGSPLDRFEPRFDMKGFGISYETGPVEISGMFLRDADQDEYTGAALIKAEEWVLKAIGSFAMVRGQPSFYLYAYLDYPIGGPAFFFVEGLAAGFGFNRSVQIPVVNEVKAFPLVAIAIGDEDFLNVAGRMADGGYVSIDIGKVFLAAGIRFTTFKQLDSFLLLIATFGDKFRLNLLGLSKLTVPSSGPNGPRSAPLAEIEMAIKGTFAPDEGFIGVKAQLTRNSYVLSRDCYLSGGYAFYTWFDPHPEAGDFVVTMGGYHPQFVRPAHYPVVPRLSFNWQVSSTVNVKGQMYFALTPSLVMAGGRMEATFRSGGLKAWFIIGADFIIGWKPYSYDARMYLNMGVSYTFWFFGKQTLSFDIGAHLHIWGPEFSGTAYVDLGIVDFTVSFGAGASKSVNPIRYSEFEESFLPSKNMAVVSVKSGLLKEIKARGRDVWVVSPKDFTLRTDSAVPSNGVEGMRALTFGNESVWLSDSDELFEWLDNTETDMNDEVKPAIPFAGVGTKADLKSSDIGHANNIGIGTVGVKKDELVTTQRVSIKKGDDDFTDGFLYRPLTKSYPVALWGEELKPDKNAERMISGLISGMEIRPKPPADPDQMGFIDEEKFKFQTQTEINAFRLVSLPSFQRSEKPEGENDGDFVRREINDALGGDQAIRNNLLRELGYDPEAYDVNADTEFGFTHAPEVGLYLLTGLVS